MGTTAAVNLLVCLFGAVLTAQEDDDRGKIIGRVTAGGAPVEGAEVILLSRPIPKRWDIGAADLLRVKTDERGRFRAQGLRGRGYTVWARMTGEDPAKISAVAEDVIPGPPVQLELGTSRASAPIRAEGAGAWKGGVRYFVSTLTTNVYRVEITPGADGLLRVPILPPTSAIVAYDVRGVLLGQAHEGTLRVPPPSEVAIDVAVSGKRGPSPVAGAKVFSAPFLAMGASQFHLVPVQVGTTDATGRCTIIVPGGRVFPKHKKRKERLLYVEGGGGARVIWPQGYDEGGSSIILPRGSTVKGRILDGKGQPVPGLTLLPEFYARGPGQKGPGGYGVHCRPIVTGVDGRFEFDGVYPGNAFRLMVLIRATRARELGLRSDAGYSLAPVLWLAAEEMAQRKVADLGDIRLDRIHVARFEVRRFNGEPAPGAVMLVTGGGSYRSPLQYLTDRVGRLQFALPPGDIRVGVFERGAGLATLEVLGTKAQKGLKRETKRITLSRPVRVSGTVVTPGGAPVVGATVTPWNRPDTQDYYKKSLAYESYGRVKSDPSGKFSLQLPYSGATFKIRAMWSAEDGRHASSKITPVSAQSEVVRGVRLVVDTGGGKRWP